MVANSSDYLAADVYRRISSQKKEETMIDITNPHFVEVLFTEDRKRIWVNVDGVCKFRACRVQTLVIHNEVEANRKEVVPREQVPRS